MQKITKKEIKNYLPKRNKFSSKIDGGSVIVIGGGKGLYGAGILATLAATRSGAGYVHLMTELEKFPWLKFPDFIVSSFSKAKLKKHKDSVIAIGPGLGISKNKLSLITYLMKNEFKKVVVDGDALTMLAKIKNTLLPASWILTPHEGELSRLLNVTSIEIKKNRIYYAKLAHKKYGCIVILKGAETIIVSSKGGFISTTGTMALAKAGSGDVLTGMIAAFYAQKNDPLEASILGCYIHGYASQIWLDEKNDYLSMRPLDLIFNISKSIWRLR